MSKKQFSVQAIFSVLTDRFYSETFTDIQDLLSHVCGKSLYTHELNEAKTKYESFIYSQLPDEMKKDLDSWEHTPDWRKKFKKMPVKYVKIEQFK